MYTLLPNHFFSMIIYSGAKEMKELKMAQTVENIHFAVGI